ncbi:Holliday junction resolvase RuvX [Candidatus Saccharibacteria bacterium]|nr:Holliday junction resolvase RuvX [Candidatus Saccharibacteria bacterium]
MGQKTKSFLALDVGEKRIGVATATDSIRIAIPLTTLIVDGSEVQQIAKIVAQEKTDTIVVGYPRNQSGEATAQTVYAEAFASQLEGLADAIYFQDESLTSVLAEDQLKGDKRPYTKADIDMRAATLILQDYLEAL